MVCSPFHWLNVKWSAVRHREGNLVSKCIRVSHVKTGGYYLYFRLIWAVCYWYLNFEAEDKFKVRINMCAFNHFQAVLVSRFVTNVERWLFLYNKWNPIKLIYLPPANEVWGKVIFSKVCIKNSVHGGGGDGWYPNMHCKWYPSMPCRFPGLHLEGKFRGIWVSRPTPKGEVEGDLAGGSSGPHLGGLLLGGLRVCSWGGGGLLPRGGCLVPGGGAWSQGVVWRPPDGYCCGRYAFYWNAFLFHLDLSQVV